MSKLQNTLQLRKSDGAPCLWFSMRRVLGLGAEIVLPQF